MPFAKRRNSILLLLSFFDQSIDAHALLPSLDSRVTTKHADRHAIVLLPHSLCYNLKIQSETPHYCKAHKPIKLQVQGEFLLEVQECLHVEPVDDRYELPWVEVHFAVQLRGIKREHIRILSHADGVCKVESAFLSRPVT